MSHTLSTSAVSLHAVACCLGNITAKSSRSSALVPSLLGRRFSFPLSISRQVGGQADQKHGTGLAPRAETGDKFYPTLLFGPCGLGMRAFLLSCSKLCAGYRIRRRCC